MISGRPPMTISIPHWRLSWRASWESLNLRSVGWGTGEVPRRLSMTP
jgi:hypothetical protein